MRDETHDLKFTVLEPLVLQNLLDGDVLAFLWRRNKLCLEDYTERTIADDLAIAVRYLPMVTCFAIGSDDLDNFGRIIDGGNLDAVYGTMGHCEEEIGEMGVDEEEEISEPDVVWTGRKLGYVNKSEAMHKINKE